jgi:hypothetical protein
MARYNSVSQYLQVTGATTFSYAINGSIIQLTGTPGYTVTLVSPAYAQGWSQTLVNQTGGACTVAVPSGTFTGNGAPGSGLTMNVPNNSSMTFVSDGTNYVVTNNEGGALTRTAITVSGSATFNGGITGNGGNITFNPSGYNISLTTTTSGSVTISPASVGTIDNMNIGATTRGSAQFSTLNVNGTSTFTGAISAATTTNNQSYSTTGAGTISISSGSTGDIDNMRIGSSTRAGAQFTTLAANAQTSFTGNISSTTSGTGTVVVTGGIGASENIRAGGNIVATGNVAGVQGQFTGNVTDNSNRVLTSVSVSAGTGMSGGGTITGPSGSVTLTNAGVLSLTGTTNRISVSASTGNITLNLPQDIQSGAAPTFTATNFSGTAASMNIGGTATYATYLNTEGYNSRFHWSGQPGQPSYLWGSNTGADVYVYNPSNFNVNCSVCANTTVACCIQGGTLAGNVTASSLTSVGTLGGLTVSGQSALCCICSTCACFQCVCVVQSFSAPAPPGSALYEGVTGTNGGTQAYTWTAPTGVSSVSVAVIGGGGGGYYGWAVCGGGGGGLTYSNNIAVTGGSNYTLQIGNGGCWSQSSGGYSCFPGIIGGGGHCGCCVGCGCNGGPGGPGTVAYPNTAGGGGGGGGYGPNQCWYSNSGHTGCYGGGGSAASHHSSTYGTGGGGGTGIYGQGNNGACGSPFNGHNTGTGGQYGSNGTCGLSGEPWANGNGHGYNCGGNYGGGGGGGGTSHGGGWGGKGAVRIVWPGATRQYPNNAG